MGNEYEAYEFYMKNRPHVVILGAGTSCAAIPNGDSKDRSQADKYSLAMCGYKLRNTLSENGKVTRGICIASEKGLLKNIIED